MALMNVVNGLMFVDVLFYIYTYLCSQQML